MVLNFTYVGHVYFSYAYLIDRYQVLLNGDLFISSSTIFFNNEDINMRISDSHCFFLTVFV